ncbi:MAG: ice-binding family protein, partial [Rhodothermales bacterium]
MKSTATNPMPVLRRKQVFPVLSLLVGVAAFILMIPADALSQSAVNLGDAAPFGVLGASTVTNTGATTVDGNLGVNPGTAVTGFPPGSVAGTIYTGTDQPGVDGQTDLTTAYNNAAGQTPVTETLAQLGGRTLVPGIYKSAAVMNFTNNTDLTLNAEGNANAVWIFQVGSALNVGTGTDVILSNSAQAANVFWQVGSSATIGTDSNFNGTILALTSITLNTRVTLCGRALADNGAVTLDTNVITLPENCVSLPVELSLFSAIADGLDVVLQWETLSERNNSGFDVQYQPDSGWETMAFVPGAGNSTERLSYQYRATELGSGTHRFRLKQIDFDGDFDYSPVVEVTVLVDQYALRAAYPNPFSLTTTLAYALPRDSEVRLSVFDVLGREVKVLVAGPQPAGSHDAVFDASNLPAGAYFY